MSLPEHTGDDYKARIDIARGIASLVPTSDAGETLVALADAVEALVAERDALRDVLNMASWSVPDNTRVSELLMPYRRLVAEPEVTD